jgi:two-component system C4-dicarboxylate transport sensor histidine kinase DctB
MIEGRSRLSADAGLTAELGGRPFAAEDLAQLNRMSVVALVLPNVAHEVNNALQVVCGLVEMVAARADLPPDAVDKLSRIGAQAGRASSLIRELVAFSRRDHAAVSLADVRKVVDAALALRRYHLARDRVSVVVEAPADGACLVRADAHYLQQVLVNLIVNAEQALRGREGPAVRVAVIALPSSIDVLVEDNGGGMDGEVSRRAGDLFFSTRQPPALGLGLAVSGALTAAQGGSLTVEPVPGGTRARVSLPRHEPAPR